MSIESTNAGFVDGARLISSSHSEEKVSENQAGSDLIASQREAFAVKVAEQANRSSNEVDAQDALQAAEALLQVAQNLNQYIQFSLHEIANKPPVIQVVDRATGDVIRQIPSNEFLDLASRMQSLTKNEQLDSATGILIDSSV